MAKPKTKARVQADDITMTIVWIRINGTSNMTSIIILVIVIKDTIKLRTSI